jgi:hypothetical protein
LFLYRIVAGADDIVSAFPGKESNQYANLIVSRLTLTGDNTIITGKD